MITKIGLHALALPLGLGAAAIAAGAYAKNSVDKQKELADKYIISNNDWANSLIDLANTDNIHYYSEDDIKGLTKEDLLKHKREILEAKNYLQAARDQLVAGDKRYDEIMNDHWLAKIFGSPVYDRPHNKTRDRLNKVDAEFMQKLQDAYGEVKFTR